MFDCHAHLTDSSLRLRLDDLLASADAAGVVGIIAVSESVEDAAQVLELCSERRVGSTFSVRVHPALGLHPDKADLDSLADMLSLIDQHKETIICIGEVGLDFSPHVIGGGEEAEHKKEVQREVFARQARRAEELGLAVNVHSRSAGHHAISLLREQKITRAVLHAFDGNPKYAVEAARAGYLFSVPPIVSRAPAFQKLVERLPIESLLLETDCPALAPVKGEVNLPANLRVPCEWISKIKKIPVETVIDTTSANARNLFPRAFASP